MSDRLPDQQVIDATYEQRPVVFLLAREVQQWRALIPEVIEQLEHVLWVDNGEGERLDKIIVTLKEAIK